MKSKNTIRTKFTVAIFVIITLVLIIFEFVIDDCIADDNIYKSFLLVVLSTCASVFGVGAAWEAIGKRSFATEILLLTGVSENYADSGIEYIYSDFNDIDWKKELESVSKLTVFVTYAYSWRNSNRKIIEKIAEKGSVTVVLPDFRSSKVCDELDRRFAYGEYDDRNKHEGIQEIIQRAAKDFQSMGAEVKLYNGTIIASYYSYDEHYIMAPFRHVNEEKECVPAVKCGEEGVIYNFCQKEMKNILNKSVVWSDESGEDSK